MMIMDDKTLQNEEMVALISNLVLTQEQKEELETSLEGRVLKASAEP